MFDYNFVGAESEDSQIEPLLKEVKGKDLAELIASGREKLASVPSGGGGVAMASAPSAGEGGGAAPTAESKKEEKKEENVGTRLFGIRDIKPISESHEIYREIYSDPIYDVYEDDEIYREICGDTIYDTYEDDVSNIDHVDFVFKHGGFNKAAQNLVHADLEQIFIPSKKFDCKVGFRKIDLVPRTRLKIRGRIFLGRRDLMQRDIWNISKYLD
ncbi:unnamed protein product [Microthlaspi erraticum]|uniref:Uncharacterized protein n=1 Tax=Microthlaspi erraticum TaxID=1685480 RepID=A0A6D2HX02_9BRAS|nr:unnamed protein product [Microthlaspi erraticum]